MNVFFTCNVYSILCRSFDNYNFIVRKFAGKNSLVILLQLYRLYVVNSEYWKTKRELKNSKQLKTRKIRKKYDDDYDEYTNKEIYMISSGKYDKKKPIRRARDDSPVDERRLKSKKDK